MAMPVLAPAPMSQGGPTHPVSLRQAEIRKAVTGKAVSYSPPDWADSGVREEYHSNGIWRGIRYGRGPIPFAGRWTIRNDQLCVQADKETIAARFPSGERCRHVWRDEATGRLWIDHLMIAPSASPGVGAQLLTISELSPER